MPKPPQAWYRLGDINPTIGSYALTNNGSVSFASDGKFGKCATFNGGNYLSSSSHVWPTGKMCIEYWVYDTGAAGTRGHICSKLYATGNSYSYFAIREWSGKLQIYVITTGASGWNANAGFLDLNTITWGASQKNTWMHVAVVIDYNGSTTSTVYVYFNNVLQNNGGTTVSGTFAFSNEINFGNYYGGYLSGALDNVKIYDYPKRDFSDRFQERGGMNDFIYFAA
jgi:hypothetical protein